MMNLSPEEKAIGKENFQGAVGVTRRDFLLGTIGAGVMSGAGLGAMYFGYESLKGDPLRVGFIGTGDEGSVLIGAHTPDYLRVVAIADIRPYNIHRAFHGDRSSPNALKVRPGLMAKYGWSSEEEARKEVKVYEDSYEDLLRDPDVEAVVIALPLHLHAEAAIKAMRAGKHVLTEKLMGHSIAECKEMSRVAQETGKYLATGHQRHYSILYDNAVDTIRRGLIGDIHHIRAQWHRGNMPGRDSWSQPLPNEKMLAEIETWKKKLDAAKDKKRFDAVQAKLQDIEARYMDHVVDAAKYGYEEKTLANGYERSPLEELIRWRLWNRTGGGLMAELGSHQLDAAGIFIGATREDGKKVLPLTVAGMGGRHIFPLDRDCDDHVYCMFEFPAPGYESDPNKKIVVTYSSINGNGFGGYGEVVFGTGGTLLLEREADVMLYKGSSTTTRVSVKAAKGDTEPTLDTTASGGGQAVETGRKAMEMGPPSRGYTEEMEHWAWCVRNPDPQNQPRCRPEIALGDAVIALTTNIAIDRAKNASEGTNSVVQFDENWFKIDSDATPEGVKPDTTQSRYDWS